MSTVQLWALRRKSDGMYCDWSVRGWSKEITFECLSRQDFGLDNSEEAILVRVTIEEIKAEPGWPDVPADMIRDVPSPRTRDDPGRIDANGWTCKRCGETGIANYEHHVCTNRVAPSTEPGNLSIHVEPAFDIASFLKVRIMPASITTQQPAIAFVAAPEEPSIPGYRPTTIEPAAHKQTHAGNPEIYAKSEVTRKVVGHVEPVGGKRVKNYFCLHCQQPFPMTGQGWADCMNHQQNCKTVPKQWKCQGCGEIVQKGEITDGMTHWQMVFRKWCGPVVKIEEGG